MPGGVISCSRTGAPPVSAMVGWPPRRLTTPMSRQKTPRAEAGAERLGARLLGGEALGVGGGARRAGRSDLRPLDLGEDAVREAVAEALQASSRCGGCR